MWYQLQQIPEGEKGTDETVALMIESVERSLRLPDLRLLTLKILQGAGAPDRDGLAQARAVFAWIVKNIRYVRDAIGVEVLQQPEITVKVRAGDCDDHTALVAAMLRSIGLPVRIKVIGTTPDTFRHVFPEVFTGEKWLPMDTTAQRPFGAPLPKLGVEKVYTFNGANSMKVKRTSGLKLSRNQLQTQIAAAVGKTLTSNWNNGLIDHDDLRAYLRVIDEKNTPFANNALLEPAIRSTISDFQARVAKVASHKAAGTVSGLEGLDGFLKSIWNAAKSVVTGAVKLITGGGTSTVKVEVTPQTPATPAPPVTIKTPVTTYTAPAPPAVVTTPPVVYQPPTTSTDFLKSPYLWIAGGALALILLTKGK